MNWESYETAAEQAEEQGNYRRALGYWNELLASAKRVEHRDRIEYYKMKANQAAKMMK